MLSRFSRINHRKFTIAKGNHRSLSAHLEGYGEHVFKGEVAEPFLRRQGLPKETIESHKWVTDGSADKVAAAVLDWALSHDATLYCHWFQPLGSAGLRHGMTGQVQSSMFEFDKKGQPKWNFTASNLLKGETDGSSFLMGNLRTTHNAAAYSVLDPTSPIFLRGDTVFIPSCLVSYHGEALDEKTPLLRAGDALSREGVRLLKHLGHEVESVFAEVGLEQELFFVPRDAYNKRLDLQMTGRTVMGRDAPRGQELCDHYMAPPSLSSPVLSCMQEVQNQAFKLGIPLRTRHREVAPNQYEFASLYGGVTTQIDQNLMVMQICEEVAVQYGLAALLQEKPFQGVNGSGKHNNWSIATSDGINLLNVPQLQDATGNGEIYPVVMAAIVKAVHQHGDLLRLAIACPGNDFRLGACEAPPALVTTHLGDDITSFLEGYINGSTVPYTAQSKLLDLGVSVLAPVEVPAEDRNRTSLFPYGGHRFEFRAVGSSQNVSLVNTVLATIVADTFREFSEAIEQGQTARDVAQKALKESWKTIFNGDGYDEANQAQLKKDGVWCINSSVDAMRRYTTPKNVALFERMGVLNAAGCAARQEVMFAQYTGVVEVEAKCVVDMLQQHVIPSLRNTNTTHPLLPELLECVITMKEAMKDLHSTVESGERADKARVLRLETMVQVRELVDRAEEVVPANLWTIATYKDLLFLDHTLA